MSTHPIFLVSWEPADSQLCTSPLNHVCVCVSAAKRGLPKERGIGRHCLPPDLDSKCHHRSALFVIGKKRQHPSPLSNTKCHWIKRSNIKYRRMSPIKYGQILLSIIFNIWLGSQMSFNNEVNIWGNIHMFVKIWQQCCWSEGKTGTSILRRKLAFALIAHSIANAII